MNFLVHRRKRKTVIINGKGMCIKWCSSKIELLWMNSAEVPALKLSPDR